MGMEVSIHAGGRAQGPRADGGAGTAAAAGTAAGTETDSDSDSGSDSDSESFGTPRASRLSQLRRLDPGSFEAGRGGGQQEPKPDDGGSPLPDVTWGRA